MHTDTVFKHSGRITLTGIPLTLLLGSALGAIAGTIYAALIYYNPLVFLNVLAIFIFGLLAGGGASAGMRTGKIRSTLVLVLLTLIVTTVAIAVSWIVWIRLMAGQWITDPQYASAVINLMSATGIWSISSWTPHGGQLYFLWIVEALIVYGCALVMSYHAIVNTPFCEESGHWADVTESKTLFAGIDVAKVVEDLKQRPNQVVQLLQKPADSVSEFIRFHLGKVETSQLRTVSIETVSIKVKDGKPEESTKVVLRNLIVDPDTFQKVETACAT